MYIISLSIDSTMIKINLLAINQSPRLSHLFGTDWLGRDMLLRTLKGLQLSISIGLVTAVLSTILGVLISFAASIHPSIDKLVTWLIDLFLSLPHLVTLILISFVLGGGFKGGCNWLNINTLAIDCPCAASGNHAATGNAICTDV
ncbi:hypothetical protein [Gracilibacillus boraciitolerans]|uniref:hypothetical protein n=1 Tax=Gracilibacillus boraciitolerans TaxID=307521 RepID=UPI003F7020DB